MMRAVDLIIQSNTRCGQASGVIVSTEETGVDRAWMIEAMRDGDD